MNAEQREILEFLRKFKEVFVSVVEVSRRVGGRRLYQVDRAWARPILMRLEIEGLVETNEFGEYRIRQRPEDTCFLDALNQANPGVSLGETTIIFARDTDQTSQ